MQAKTFVMLSTTFDDLISNDVGFHFGHAKQVCEHTGSSHRCLQVFTKYHSNKKHEFVLMYQGKSGYVHVDSEMNNPEDLERLRKLFHKKQVPFIETTTVTHSK